MTKRGTTRECPLCGELALRERRGVFHFEPPPNVLGGAIEVADATWDECRACGEKIIAHELDRAIDDEARRRQGLLTPDEIKAIRGRAGLSQVEIAQLSGVGEKTYTRWETGKSIQNKSNDNLIRLIDQDPGVLARLEAQRQPDRRKIVARYFRSLSSLKGSNPHAVAAHGIELGVSVTRELRARLRSFMCKNATQKPDVGNESPTTRGAFRPSFLEIESHELVRFLLDETEQSKRDAVNPAELLSFLGLQHICFSFEAELPSDVRSEGKNPRALLSFADRLVATDETLHKMQARFSILHEIAHYVLPSHEYAMYLDNEQCMSSWTRICFEREANELAADLLFQGDRFTLEANSHSLSAKSVKKLGRKYDASFESTARRLVERNLRPAMLVVFKRENSAADVDADIETTWNVRYCATSPTFRNQFFKDVEGTVPPDIARKLARPGIDIADSERAELHVPEEDDTNRVFSGEFFTNTHNIFCLVQPRTK